MNPGKNSNHGNPSHPRSQAKGVGGNGMHAHTNGNIPRLQIQPGTPVPDVYPSTRNTPIPPTTSTIHNAGSAHNPGLERVLEESRVQLPQIIPSSQLSNQSQPHYGNNRAAIAMVTSGVSAGMSSRRSGVSMAMNVAGRPGVMTSQTDLSKSIKQDTSEYNGGYGASCTMSNSQVNLRNSSHGYHSRQQLTNHQMQTMAPGTPTPSDISSIHATPRLGGSMESARLLTGMSGTPGAPDSPQKFLEPGLHGSQKEQWGSYKVLPGLGHGMGSVSGSEGGDRQQSAMSQYTNGNCLWPSDFSPPEYHRNNKRARSTSTVSSGSFDILTMIRSSPTALHALGSQGSPSSGSFHLGAFNTGSATSHGAMGHYFVRNSMSSSQSGSAHEGPHHARDIDHALDLFMGGLDQTGTGSCVDMTGNNMTNHMVIQQDMSIRDHYYKPGYASPAPSIPSQHGMHAAGNTYDASMPPPPPYPIGIAPRIHHQNAALQRQNGQMHRLHHQQPTSQQQQQQQQPLTHLQQQPLLPQQPHQQVAAFDQSDELSPLPNGMTETIEAEDSETSKFTCKWIDCNHIFSGRNDMVQHIEKVHIDQRRGDDFTCYWQGCVRRYKPFNARYKLLIHMRVHSGEKPNKCTFEGCDKAFSRLENLKIHLRSHTGERPYLCQQVGCTKAFSNSSDRAKHQRTHVDTKPYACQISGCNKRYTDPSSLRKHVKSHDSKEQQARKKVRQEDFVQPPILNNCLLVNSVKSNGSPMDITNQHQRSDMYPGMQFGTGALLPQSPCVPDSQQHGMSNSVSQTYEHHVGGGFQNAVIGPGRRTGTCHNIPTANRRPPTMSHTSLPTLHGTKLGPNMGQIPPPPPYPQEQSPQEAQWQQSPTQPVPTPSPQEVSSTLPADTSPQVSLQSLDTSMSTVASPGAYSQHSPHPYVPDTMPSAYHNHLQVPNQALPQRHPHINYVPQAGNVPLANDYAGMPCNLQERMTAGQQNPHAFHMQMTLEDTLANLPYDAIQLQRALPNHSGASELSLNSPKDFDVLSVNNMTHEPDGHFLQLNTLDRCNSRLSAVSVYGDGSVC